MDKFSELKAAAMAATPGPWFVHEKPCEDGNYGIDTSDNEWTAEAVVWWGFARQSIWKEEDARFIAAANPAVVLAMLAELEAKDKRISELEAKLATPVRLLGEMLLHDWEHRVERQATFQHRKIAWDARLAEDKKAILAAGFTLTVEGDE